MPEPNVSTIVFPLFGGGEGYITLIDFIFVLDLLKGMIHDSILQWAYGVNKTIEEGFAPDNGLRITKNIINMTFQGITGKVGIDHLGNRDSDQRFEYFSIILHLSGTYINSPIIVNLPRPSPSTNCTTIQPPQT